MKRGSGKGEKGRAVSPGPSARGGASFPVSDSPLPASEGIAPSLAELIALRRSALRARDPRRAQRGVAARATSAQRGRGMEYAESREYVAGDDARHIDWKLSARTGFTHTKTFQAERERLTLVVADTAPALYFGTRTRFKSVQAARAGAVAAWSALRDGDRVAALCGGREDGLGAARRRHARRAARARCAGALAGIARRPPMARACSPRWSARRACCIRARGRWCWPIRPVPWPVAPATWSALAMHVDVRLLLLVDPLEMQPPHCLLPVAAAGGRMEFDLSADAVRDAWHAAFVAPVQTLCQALPGRRIRVQVLATDEASDAWLGAAGA